MIGNFFKKFFQRGVLSSTASPRVLQRNPPFPRAPRLRPKLTLSKQIIIGSGCLLIMILLPNWALFQLPLWPVIHRSVQISEIQAKDDNEEVDAVDTADPAEQDAIGAQNAEKEEEEAGKKQKK